MGVLNEGIEKEQVGRLSMKMIDNDENVNNQKLDQKQGGSSLLFSPKNPKEKKKENPKTNHLKYRSTLCN